MAHVEIIIPNSGGMTIQVPHNLLDGLQGNGEDYYHLDQSQYDRVLDLIYENYTINFFNSPITGERGLSTDITLTYNIDSNDDTILTASINQGVGNILSGVNQGNQIISGGSRVNNTTYNLTFTYERNGQSFGSSRNTTYTTYIPQWSGLSNSETLQNEGYVDFTTNLNKVVQLEDTISIDVAPVEQYIWFISTNANASVTNNGFNTIIGEWNDPTAFFWKTDITLVLADGSTTENLTIYRTRELKNHSNQNYTIT